MGRFSSDFVVGCAPLTVNLTINDSFGNIVRQYIYEDGQSATNDTFHTYNTPGTFEIIQIIQSQNPRTDTLTITVFDPVVPTFEIFNCSGSRARIIPTDDSYDFYRVFFEDDSITVLPNEVSDIINFSDNTVKNIRLRGFLNDAPNNCGEVSFNFVPISTIETPVINSLSVTQHCQNLGQVNLQLTAIEAVRHLVEVSTDQINFEVLDTISSVTMYQMNDVPINSSTICLRLTALDECDGLRIESDIVCQDELNIVLPATEDITASFTNQNSIGFEWQDIPVSPVDFEIFRASFNNSPSSLAIVDNPSFSDTGVSGGEVIFDYQIVSLDTCGNQSASSRTVRPIFLSADQDGTNNFNFEWNNYLGWANEQTGVEYTLEILDATEGILESISLDNSNFTRNIARDPGNTFRVRGTDTGGNRSVISNSITLQQESEVQVPTAFSPNGDGLNEVFSPIIVEDVVNFQMQIFNRWGELIFISTSRLVGWDGRDQRGTAQSGTYVYQISFNEENGNTFNQTGTFLLIK